MRRVPKEIVGAINIMLKPFGASFSQTCGDAESGKCMSLREAADYLCVSRSGLYAYIKSGEIPCVKLGTLPTSRVVLRKEDLDNFVKAHLSNR